MPWRSFLSVVAIRTLRGENTVSDPEEGPGFDSRQRLQRRREVEEKQVPVQCSQRPPSYSGHGARPGKKRLPVFLTYRL